MTEADVANAPRGKSPSIHSQKSGGEEGEGGGEGGEGSTKVQAISTPSPTTSPHLTPVTSPHKTPPLSVNKHDKLPADTGHRLVASEA